VTVLVYLPLATTGRPEGTARTLAACAAVAAWASAGSLALLALTLLDDLPAMEIREHLSGYLLPEPVSARPTRSAGSTRSRDRPATGRADRYGPAWPLRSCSGRWPPMAVHWPISRASPGRG
jgi:hypothetical protein